MVNIYAKAKQLVTYIKLSGKSKSGDIDPLQKIFRFHKELVEMGIGADFQLNENAGTEPVAKYEGIECLMFASNNYLGLSTNSEVIHNAEIALHKHGLGPGGSRFLCGNVDILSALDKKIAELVGMEDAITFPTGYMANLAVFSAVTDPLFGSLPFSKGKGVIFSDEYNHGTIVDGCRLSHAKKIIFRHNDLNDLRRKIAENKEAYPKMIVTEGVFTPHGDLSPLPEIVKIARENNAIMMIDDAHGIGVLGKHGGGTSEYYGLQGKVDIIMGSFDKALGGMGGFLAGRKELIEYFRIAGRPYIFSSSVPSVLAGGMLTVIDKCQSAHMERKRIFDHAEYLRSQLSKMGYRILGTDKVPVVLVYIGDENKSIEFSKQIFSRGIYCPSFRWPAVPEGEARIRITVMASHTIEHLDRLLEVFQIVGRKMNII